MLNAIFSIFAVPFGYVMEWIYRIVGSYGLSIIIFSLLAKLILIPFSIKSKKAMVDSQRIYPKLQVLQKKYGADKQRYQEELQALYDREGVSMFAGCGPTLITFPFLIGLYQVISQPLTYFMHLTQAEISSIAEALGYTMGNGYSAQIGLAHAISDNFAAAQAVCDKVLNVDFSFLGINLAATPSIGALNLLWIIPILSGATAYLMTWFQRKLQAQSMPNIPMQQMQGAAKFTMMLTPLMSVYFGFILPAGLGLYWTANNIFSMAQEYVLTKFILRDYIAKANAEAALKPKKKKAKKPSVQPEPAPAPESGAGNQPDQTDDSTTGGSV